MNIVIISEFCEDFSKSDNDRFFYLAKMLADDNDVEIITSSFHHTTKSQRNKPAMEWPFKITFIEEPGYPKNVCLKRFQSHHVWGRNVAKYLRERKKPDVVYCAVPSLTGPSLVAKYCEKNDIRFVIDVQDLWPEAFQMVINIPVLSSIGFAPFSVLANGIYKRADAICAVSDTYCQRALKVNRKCKEGTTVFLGTELATFDRYAAENPVLEKEKDEVWLVYCGTLGSSYDLICVIDALTLLREEKIRFVVIGDGPRQDEFKVYAKEQGVNVTFTGRLQYNRMCSLLKACDITINPIAHMAAQSIVNEHAASGLPVVSTQENDEYRKLIDEYQMGLNSRNNDAKDLAEKISLLVKDESLRKTMGNNARKCAQERFDRDSAYCLLENQILAVGGYSGLVKYEGEIWLGYAGTLGTSYDLPVVFDALRKVKNEAIRFIVMGDGPSQEKFESDASGLYVTFTGRLSYEQTCGVLAACDIVINPIVGTSVATIINKHADYAASGKPVLNTQKSEEYRKLIETYQIGYNCVNGINLAKKLDKLANDKKLRLTMGTNARKCAAEKFNKTITYEKLLKEIVSI